LSKSIQSSLAQVQQQTFIVIVIVKQSNEKIPFKTFLTIIQQLLSSPEIRFIVIVKNSFTIFKESNHDLRKVKSYFWLVPLTAKVEFRDLWLRRKS
jgi:hypothetical protein